MEENRREIASWTDLLYPAVKAKEETGGELVHVSRRTPKNYKTRPGYHPIRMGTLLKQVKIKCPDCDTMLYPKTLLVHKRYFCNKEPPKNLKFKILNNHLALCLKCKRKQHHESIILHSQYLCKNNYVRCFYCPAVFKGHTAKKSSLMGHITHIHSKGMYEVNDLVSKLGPDDIHEDEDGVVYTSYQSFEVQEQASDISVSQGNVVEKNLFIKQGKEDPLKDIFIKQEDQNPPESVLIKEDKELPEGLDYSQFGFHSLNSDMSFSNFSVEKDFIPPPKWKKEPKHELLSICPKCSKLICPSIIRLHKKYFCGKTPDDRLGWKINRTPTSGTSCFRCGKSWLSPNYIEFHVAYVCGKRPITVQCFYCDQFHDNYKSLLNHMTCVHYRKHEWLDLLSVLPPADDLYLENSLEENKESKVVKVYFGGLNNTLQNWNDSSFSKSKIGQDTYKCFYCDVSFDLIFQTLDHMEELHFMKHSTYDVLRENIKKF